MSALTIHHHPLVRVRPRRDAVVVPFPGPRTRRPEVPGPVAPPAPLRITRRGRLAVTLVLAAAAAVACAVLVLSALPAPVTAPGASAAPTQEVTVLPGDTLWEIASAARTPGADIRDVMAEIRELNAMETSGVAVGQELLVPAG